MLAPLPRLAAFLALAALASGAGAAEEYHYTPLDLEACDVLQEYEEGGGVELRCDGYGGFDVLVSDGDARMDVDFGVSNGDFQTFSAFNSVGSTVEWLVGPDGVEAAIIRFLIDVDGRRAQALVVSKVGTRDEPGCVIGVVNAASDQANGVARGLGAMAPAFDCETDSTVILAGGNRLVADYSGARP